jgi:predicted alpha/beta-fold hydrolase
MLTPARRSILRTAVLVTLAAIYIRRYLLRMNKITYMPSSTIAKYIVGRVPLLKSYICTPYLITGAFQSIQGMVFGPTIDSSVPVIRRREVIHFDECKKPSYVQCCPDVIPSGLVSVDWHIPADQGDFHATSSPVVILVPGLTGSSHDEYILTIANRLVANGYRAACYNPRGRGNNKLLTPFLYCAGYTHDLRRTISRIRQHLHPDTPLMAAGFSMGSNVLTLLMGEDGDACEIDAGMSLACPLDLVSTVVSLKNRPFGHYVVDGFLANMIKGTFDGFEENFPEYDGHLDIDHIREADCMSDFDHRANAPMFGFKCASDYYRYASSSLKLSEIRRPMIFVHAWQDPIIPGEIIRTDNFTTNPFLVHAMTASGGREFCCVDMNTGSYIYTCIHTYIHTYIHTFSQVDTSRVSFIPPTDRYTSILTFKLLLIHIYTQIR